MTGTRIDISVEMAEVRAMLDRLGKEGTDDLMPQIGEYLVRSTDQRFTDQVKPDGTHWKELSPAYAGRKRKNKDKILTLERYLRSSIRFQPAGAYAVSWGTNVEYAAIQQLGGTIDVKARQATVRYRSVAGRVLFASKNHEGATVREVTIPAHQVTIDARPFLGVSSDDDKQIQEIAQDWLEKRING
ncbi:MAG: phage virion morphogenesis protein [Rhodoferax sp.]|nr:phage virion morphogenesis protein [Rhodoferax sp.]